jgi:hypothetical protein
MAQKEYGKFTLEQLKELKNLLNQSQQLAPTLEQVIQESDPKKLERILGDNFSWFHYYELSFIEHMAMGALILNWQSHLKEIAKAKDPQQAFFDFFYSIKDDENWEGGFNGLFEMNDLLGLVISIFRTMKSLMVHQKSLSTLIQEVRNGSDTSLFNAVRLDRTVLACPSVVHRVSVAELKGDNDFFIHLRNAVKGPSQKHMVALDPLRYMMAAVVESGGDHLSSEAVEELFVDQLQLYAKQPTAQKNLYEQFLKTKRIYHPK